MARDNVPTLYIVIMFANLTGCTEPEFEASALTFRSRDMTDYRSVTDACLPNLASSYVDLASHTTPGYIIQDN